MIENSPLTRIPFKRMNFSKALEKITPLLESGYIGLGNLVFDTEKKLAEFVGAKEVVLVDSCTSALFLSLKYEQLKSERKLQITIPSMTVPLAANAVLEAGCEMIFDTRTDWVGRYYRMDGSNVIDSAHELKRNQYPAMVKEFGENMKLCFSFYPTKTIGSADGGAIATDDVEFAKWARSAATYGRNQGTKYKNSWDFDVEMIGYKRHYTNLQAAIVLEQLERLDETTEARQRVVRIYNDNFGYDNKSDYLYRIEVMDRDKFIEFMLERGIECGVHFKPLHLMTPFREFPVFYSTMDENARDLTPREIVEEAYIKTVSLPLYADLTIGEIDRIVTAVKQYIQK